MIKGLLSYIIPKKNDFTGKFSCLVELSDFDNYFFYLKEEDSLQAASNSDLNFISNSGIPNIICEEPLKIVLFLKK